jgi:hypothetical protein
MRIGEKVEARAKELRIGPTELARKIKTSKQNVYHIYKRESIDTELLMRLSKVLDYDFFQYYRGEGDSMVQEPRATGYSKTRKQSAGMSTEMELLLLRKEFQLLKDKYDLLKELYEAKTGKKAPGH